MKLDDLWKFDLMEGEEDHWKALNDTGYYGRQGAGTIPFALDTKQFLISHRSKDVEQPGTWGTWGGAIEDGEDPKQAAMRELQEEAGYKGNITMMPLYVFNNKSFRYSNFLAVVDAEFKPVLNWETQGFRWCKFGQWPKPLHFGLQAVVNDPASVATMQRIMEL